MTRRIRPIAATALCAFTITCGSSERAEQAATKQAEPSAPSTLGAALAAGTKTPPALAKSSEAAAADARPTFLETQLGHKMSEYKFLGWTAGGAQFVLETLHGDYAWDPDARRHTDSGLQVMRMRIVYDTLTQKSIARFKLSNKLPKSDNNYKTLAAAWQESREKADWKPWLANHPLMKPTPSIASPDGLWKLKAKLDKKSVNQFTNITLKKKKSGFYTMWAPWQSVFPEGMPPDQAAAQAESQPLVTPKILVSSAKGKATWNAIRYRIPWSDDQTTWMGADSDMTIRGNLRVFWTPDSERYLLATFHKSSDDSTFSAMREAAFFLRTPGPQIALRDGGAGMTIVRAKAKELSAASLPVQQINGAKAAVTETTVYYRGKAKSTADAVARKLGATKVEKLTSKGWLDVVAVIAAGK